VHDKQLPYVYIVVRKDLDSTAYQAVQCAHAGIQATRQGLVKSLQHPVLVLLTVENELELLRLSANLHNQGIKNVAFYEDDIDSFSALATEVIDGDDRKRRKVFKSMKLLE
jgi:peptidyl-tRNA hydrolase